GQFLVMAFVPGDDLGARLRHRKKSFPLHEVLHWAKLLLDVLGHLHAQEPPIVHGDIKPGNLKPSESGGLILLDFELSKDAMGAARAATGRTLAGHTARYSAPEWVEGKPTDARTDLYALGATLYHLLAGVPPPAALDRERAERIRQPDPLQSLALLNPGVPRPVSEAITRAMALDPEARFASAEEMRTALYGGGRDSTVLAALASQTRRVDAAAPSWVLADKPFDFLVQVRFFDSPRLGREDWPVEQGAAAADHAPGGARLSFAPSPWSDAVGPAALVVRIMAPDFRVEGGAEQPIDVPPDDYSPRIRFRLHPTKTEPCRITAEVYTRDGVGLGAIPVDVRVGGELARPPLRVAHLLLRADAGREAAQSAATREPSDANLRRAVVHRAVEAEPPAALDATRPVPAPTFGAISRDDEIESRWGWKDVAIATLAMIVAVFVLAYVITYVRR
ncbi:MAG: serine/threonine protein kinase, partial [Bacteroidales bacterium]